MRSHSRRRRFGNPPESHADRAVFDINEAEHAGRRSMEAAVGGRCSEAFSEVLSARGFLSSGLANASASGEHRRHEIAERRKNALWAVTTAERDFVRACLVRKRGSRR